MYKLNLDQNKRYLLACSYGPDSMALFFLLQNQGYKFDCAIVNYHLREESNCEVEGLQKYATKFNTNIHVLDVKEIPTKNIEAKCRDIRYKFFKELTDKYGYDATLVAHHQDDLIETYLLQKDRQNSPIYFGIAEKTDINGVNIIRPLLDYSKDDLLTICRDNKVPYSVDKSNFDVTIKRNKIRHEKVSKMSLTERDAVLSEINSKNLELRLMFEKFDRTDLSLVNNILTLDSKEQGYALNYLCKKYGINSTVSKENVGEIVKVLKSNKPNGEFKIKNGLYLIKEYDSFVLLSHPYKVNAYSYKINKPCKLNTPYFNLDFNKDTSNRNVSVSDYPLTIRTVKPTDSISINGYHVTANRLMIDWKMPYRVRQYWPVIVNKDNKVIYIPRYRKDFFPNDNLNFFVKISK